jgi:hypothetical protein
VEPSPLLLLPFTGLLYQPWMINTDDWGTVSWKMGGKETRSIRGNLPQCRFSYYNSHITWSGLEPGPPQWEVGDSRLNYDTVIIYCCRVTRKQCKIVTRRFLIDFSKSGTIPMFGNDRNKWTFGSGGNYDTAFWWCLLPSSPEPIFLLVFCLKT